jgi:hypothetical protein
LDELPKQQPLFKQVITRRGIVPRHNSKRYDYKSGNNGKGGIDYGMIYYCPKCRAYVGVHAGTDRAKGRLANAELRRQIEGKE